MWEICGIPFGDAILHEVGHCLYSLLFLSVTFCASRAISWLVGWDWDHITSTSGFSLLGFSVSLVLVSHYLADEVWVIVPPWV